MLKKIPDYMMEYVLTLNCVDNLYFVDNPYLRKVHFVNNIRHQNVMVFLSHDTHVYMFLFDRLMIIGHR